MASHNPDKALGKGFLPLALCPQNETNRHDNISAVVLSSGSSASSSLGNRWKLYHFGHEHSAFFFGLWSKHSDFNQLFSFVRLLVPPRTAHVVPELFKAIILFSDRASDVISLPADQIKTQLRRDA